mgnify:CR=1 FL=1
MDDKEINLIKLSQQGDISSFEELVSIYQQKIFNIAYYKVQDLHLAEDVAQEVIIRIFKKIKTFKFQSSFSSWIYKITCNIINDVIKKMRPSFEISIEDVKEGDYSETENLDDELEKKIKAQKLRNLISKIPHKFQIVLILYEFEGKTYEEIAEILNKNINTIKTRLYRARQILKKLILKENKEILE